ncbi:MAG: hypothetical protein WCF79_21975 [Rhodomicrobium sp.]
MRANPSEVLFSRADAFDRWGGRAPILIGVTGHRNIHPGDTKLSDAVKAECARLRKHYIHSPFVVLSSLAEGADRLVARVAMEELSAELIAVLPMPQNEYERDFLIEESKAEFRSFLSRACFVKEASIPEGDACDASRALEGEQRNRQYARAGAIVADHAQVLFAIWDGKPARGRGGTGDQVAWFERGDAPNEYSLYKEAMSPLDPLEPGLLIRIDPATAKVITTKCPVQATSQGASAGTDIRQILDRIDRYNRDVLRNKTLIASSPHLAASGEDPSFAVTDLIFRASDALSALFAKTVRNSDGLIYALALGAVAVFNFVTNKAWAPSMYLGITLVMAILAAGILARSVDNRFLEYRCLAEAARTLFFWRNAGVMRPLWITLLSRQPGAMHWVRQAARSMEFCQDGRLAANGPTPEGLDIAKTCWVDDQKAWLAKKERYHLERYRFWKWASRLAIAASFVTAIGLALLTVIPHGGGGSLWESWVKPDNYGDFWQAALGLFAGGGVAARGFLMRRAHLELAKQYASQKQIFETASRMLDKIKDDPKPEWTAVQILEKLGHEALQEQTEWLWLRHTRPFEVPAA